MIKQFIYSLYICQILTKLHSAVMNRKTFSFTKILDSEQQIEQQNKSCLRPHKHIHIKPTNKQVLFIPGLVSWKKIHILTPLERPAGLEPSEFQEFRKRGP